MDLEDLIDRILPCIERHEEGRNATTRERRRAIVRYFRFCTIYSAPVSPDAMIVLTELGEHNYDFAEGWNRLLDAGDNSRRIPKSVADVVLATQRRFGEALAAAPDALQIGNLDEAAAIAMRTLRQVCDWELPGNLQAYLFSRTGEILSEELLHKERHLLIEAVRRCARELE